MWLVCGTTFGRGKNKLLIRGIEGAEWVFCPIIKSTKRDRVSIGSCQRCRHFIRFEQTYIPYIPQIHTTRKTLFIKKIELKGTFHVARTLNRSKAILPSAPLFPHIPGLIKERQPLVDVFEEEDHLIVLAELPGIDEKDVNIKTDESSITITAENATKKYFKIVRLPTRIKKDAIKFTYRNSILQVRLKKIRGKKHT